MNNKITLSIIIVNWNTHDLLRQCLKSIYQETKNIDFEIFVVDNNSRDKSVEMVQQEFPQVKLIVNQKNLGFAYANNQAIKRSGGAYILLLNPDTIILENAIEKCIKFLENQRPHYNYDHNYFTKAKKIIKKSSENELKKKIGVLGCKLLNPNKTWQPSCRTFPTLFSQIIILLKIHNLFPSLIKKYLMLEIDQNKSYEISQVMGAFFLIKKEVIEKIGLLDKKYWIWFEEVDFCKRAKLAGYKIFYWPSASIIHYKAQSFNQVLGIKKQWHLNASMLHYFWKFSKFGFPILLLLWPVSMLLALIVQIMQLVIPVRKKKYL
ncbi:MAG: glycosyltransferase family 2 protein [Patescibacteria group bacterium]